MTLEKVIDQIKSSSFYREIQKRDQEKIATERQRCAKDLRQLDEDAITIAKEYHAQMEKVDSEIEKLKEKIEQKKLAKAKIESQYRQKEHPIKLERERCLQILKDSADDRIDETISLFDEKFRNIRQAPSPMGGDKAVAFIRSGKETLRAMKLVPKLDEKKLRELISGLSKNCKIEATA